MVKKAAKKGGVKPARRKPVQQNATGLTAQKERAVLLVAEDRLTDELIAADLQVDRSTLHRWKLEAAFRGRVEEVRGEIRERLVALGVAAKQNRLKALNDRHERMAAVIAARALEHKAYAGGGATGLLVRQVKIIGKGEDAREVEEYQVDVALLREMRETEKQAAIEVGEWTEKKEHTGKDGEDLFKHITVEIVDPHEGSDE